MTRYSPQQIYTAAVKAGFSVNKTGGDKPESGAGWAPAEVIAAIAMGESGGDDQATANTSREFSVGVYQINLMAHPEVKEADARDLNASSVIAYRLSNQGTNFLPWTIYKNGSYLHFLPLASAPAGAFPGADPTGGTSAPSSTDTNPPTGNTILGLTVPTTAELQEAGIVVSVALFALFVMGVSVYAFVKD